MFGFYGRQKFHSFRKSKIYLLTLNSKCFGNCSTLIFAKLHIYKKFITVIKPLSPVDTGTKNVRK